MPSTVAIRALSMFITALLNSHSDHFNIPAMSASNACLVSSNCVVWLLLGCDVFFLRVRHVVSGKGTAAHRFSVLCWWAVVEGEAFYRPVTSSQAYSEPAPLDCDFHKSFLELFSLLRWVKMAPEWARRVHFPSSMWKARTDQSWYLPPSGPLRLWQHPSRSGSG